MYYIEYNFEVCQQRNWYCRYKRLLAVLYVLYFSAFPVTVPVFSCRSIPLSVCRFYDLMLTNIILGLLLSIEWHMTIIQAYCKIHKERV